MWNHIYIYIYIEIHIELHTYRHTLMLDISLGADGASLQVPQYVLEDALEKSGPRATGFWSDLDETFSNH